MAGLQPYFRNVTKNTRIMDHTKIKMLISFLESNSEYLNRLQNDFVSAIRKQYKSRGIITNGQLGTLEDIKEKIPVEVEV